MAESLAIMPHTGEEILGTATDRQLVDALRELRALQAAASEARRAIDAEITARMDSVASWTRHLDDGTTLTAPSPEASRELSPELVRDALVELADAGEIGVEAVDAALRVEAKVLLPWSSARKLVPWLEQQPPAKVSKVSTKLVAVAAGCKAVAKTSEHAARVMDACKVDTGAPRPVRIKERP